MTPLFRKVDCVRLPVTDLDAAVTFYRDSLGHEIRWRTPTSVGLGMPESDAEIVVHTEGGPPETDLLVDAADDAVMRIVDAGGSIVQAPFNIAIGRCALVRDPFGNVLVVLDMSRGPLQINDAGNVIDS